MALEKLTVERLDSGRALQEFNRVVLGNTEDLIARNGITGPRTAKLTITQETQIDPVTGELIPLISYSISSTVPGVKSHKLTGAIVDGQVMLPGEIQPLQKRLLDGLEHAGAKMTVVVNEK